MATLDEVLRGRFGLACRSRGGTGEVCRTVGGYVWSTVLVRSRGVPVSVLMDEVSGAAEAVDKKCTGQTGDECCGNCAESLVVPTTFERLSRLVGARCLTQQGPCERYTLDILDMANRIDEGKLSYVDAQTKVEQLVAAQGACQGRIANPDPGCFGPQDQCGWLDSQTKS